MSYKDLAGQRFGRLVAIKKVGTNKCGAAIWRCMCDCGKVIETSSSNLLRGDSQSCGCYREEQKIKACTKHGDGSHIDRNRLYHIWADAKSRCKNPNHKAYPNYGGRGIQFCSEWDNYVDFKAWALTHGYNEALTIERIDVNGNYEPQNCRWATLQEQAQNTRRTHRVEYNGRTLSISQWSKELNIPCSTIACQLKEGMSMGEIINRREMLTDLFGVKYNEYGGENSAKHLDSGISQQDMKLTITVEELAKQLNISRGTAYNLVRRKDFYPAFRIGQRVLVSADALSNWIREQTEGKA